MIYKTTIEVPVIVHYEAHPFIKGGTDGPGGPPLEPDEPAHIEIDYAELDCEGRDTVYVDLTKEQSELIREQIAESLDDDNDAAYEAHCDRMREERRGG